MPDAAPQFSKPPTDWEAVYAADPGTYFFGEEPKPNRPRRPALAS